MENGGKEMEVIYNEKTDLLYIRIDPKKREVINQRVNEDVILDIGEGDRIIGIEIMNAARRVNLKEIFPIKINSIDEPKKITKKIKINR